MSSAELLVFQHIPKTAGTTWRAIAWQQVPDNAACALYDDDGYFYSRAEFAALPEARKRKFRLLYGHFGQEVQTLLPRGAAPRFATFLRNPLERCLSQINHFANHHRKGGEVTVRSLIAERNLQIDNLQVRMLSGARAAFGEVRAEMVDEALARLEDYAFLGQCHRFAESYALAVAQLGWRPVPFERRNVGRYRAAIAGIPPAERRRLGELNRYDALLVRRAARLFEDRVRAARRAAGRRWRDALAMAERCAGGDSRMPYRSQGAIGRLGPGDIRGWARLRQSDQPALVEALLDGKAVARAEATLPRPVLAARGFEPAGRCGFRLALPPGLATMQSSALKVRVVQSGVELRRPPG